MFTIKSGNQILVPVFGTIRNSPDGWHFIDDDKHTSNGFSLDTLEITSSNYLVLPFLCKMQKVGAVVAVNDESNSQTGIHLGCSVGQSYALVKFSDRDGNVIPPNKVSSSGNYWIDGKMWLVA